MLMYDLRQCRVFEKGLIVCIQHQYLNNISIRATAENRSQLEYILSEIW